MSVVLARIDDRLIHGQVTVGWGRSLQPDQIILCNDSISEDQWQKQVYASAVPPEITVSILNKADTTLHLSNCHEGDKIILLVEKPEDMFDLVCRGVKLSEVNTGGMHHSKNKIEMFEFVYVDKADLTFLRRLLDDGMNINAQAVPGSKKHDIDYEVLDTVEALM